MSGLGWGEHWCVGVVIYTHTHAHVHMHMHVKHANHAKHGCLHVGGHLQFLYMYKGEYVCVHACVCMCVGDTPHAPRCL